MNRSSLSAAVVALFVLFPGSGPLAADGGPDTTFSFDGKLVWDAGETAVFRGVAASATKAHLFGFHHVGGNSAFYMQSVSNDGHLTTPECEEASSTLFGLSVLSVAFDGLFDSSGNLLVVGYANFLLSEEQLRPLVARVDVSSSVCTLDDTFSSNGWATYSLGPCAAESCIALDVVEIGPLTGAVQAPRLVVLVYRSDTVYGGDLFLLGITGSGAVDSGFGSSGWVPVDLPPGVTDVDSPELASDGRGRLYLVAGLVDSLKTLSDYDVHLLRFDADGEPDENFGGVLGRHQLPEDGLSAASYSRGLQVEPGGVALTPYLHDSGKWSIDGYLDGSVHEGLRTTPCTSLAMVTQGPGQFITAGDLGALDGFQLVRRKVDLAADLPMDSSFGNNIVDVEPPVGSGVEDVRGMTLWSGRPLVFGTVEAEINDRAFLYRVESSYLFADGFEQGTPAYWSDAPGIVFP